MGEREELLQAALDVLDEGMVLLDRQDRVVLWNHAAAVLTGQLAMEMLWRACPRDLYRVDELHLARVDAEAEKRARGPEDRSGFGGRVAAYADGLEQAREAVGDGLLERPALVAMKHKLGHAVPAMLRRLALRNGLAEQVGVALVFFPVDEVDALPRGATTQGVGIERCQAAMEDRLEEAQHQWLANGVGFGLMWLTIDQAAGMRKTHGREACESMLATVEQTLARGLKAGETLARWGDDEFLVLSHERTAELLLGHAERTVGLMRTAEFRWWGDRVNLTASIGATQAVAQDTLPKMLHRARVAAERSRYAGGNHACETRGL